MDDRDRLIRVLGILLLASSAISAFCISLMGYTFVTGDLPFSIVPLASNGKTIREAGRPAARPPVDPRKRPGELFAEAMFAELTAERQNLAREKEALAQQRQLLTELAAGNEMLKQEAEKAVAKLEQALDAIDTQEQANAKQVAGAMAVAEVGDVVKMVMAMEERAAARAFFFLPPKRSSELISAMLKAGDEPTTQRAARILEHVHRMAEKGTG